MPGRDGFRTYPDLYRLSYRVLHRFIHNSIKLRRASQDQIEQVDPHSLSSAYQTSYPQVYSHSKYSLDERMKMAASHARSGFTPSLYTA